MSCSRHRQGYCDGINSIVGGGLLFISHQLIRYESSRGHKINGTKPNQTGNTFGQKKQENQTEENGQEGSQQRTSSPGRDTTNAKHSERETQKAGRGTTIK